MEEIIIGIIVHAGSARAQAIQAIQAARGGKLEEADTLLAEAQTSLIAAHGVQTELIQAEARGENQDMSLLMVHAQDHLMTAMSVKDLAKEMVAEITHRLALQAQVAQLLTQAQ